MTNRSAQPAAADGQGAPASDVVMATVNAVIQELFAVGLDLAACAEMVQGRPADRLAKAVDDLDAVIAHIRTAVFAHLLALDTSGSCLLGDGTEGGIGELVDQIGALAGRIDALVQTAPVQHAGIVGFLDAAHDLHRAHIGLAGDLHPPGQAQTGIHRPAQAGLEGQTTNAIPHPTALTDGRLFPRRGPGCLNAGSRPNRHRRRMASLTRQLRVVILSTMATGPPDGATTPPRPATGRVIIVTKPQGSEIRLRAGRRHCNSSTAERYLRKAVARG